MRLAGSLLAIMLVLPSVAQADEQAVPREVGRILDVPGLGEVSVPEQGYQELRDLLNSDDPADRQRAFALLQRTQNEESDGSAEENTAPQGTGPISMLPPGVFAVRHPPPESASSSAAPSNAPDLAEPFDHLPTKSHDRLW